MSRLSLLAALLLSGCGIASRAALFTSIPEFTLVAEPVGAPNRSGRVDEGVALSLSGVQESWIADDLCGEDDGESCKDDLFVGFAFFRSEDGAYGEYVELAVDLEGEWLDPLPASPETAWRAAVVRQEEEDVERLEQVSIAAVLPVE